jgi:DNA-binding transcriptional regulator YdaS (Cro superfamily)
MEISEMMTKIAASKPALAVLCAALLGLSACSTDQVIDGSVRVAAGTTKVVAKGAIGAGKLAYHGGAKAVGALK